MRKTRPQTRLSRVMSIVAGLGAACVAAIAVAPRAASAGACDGILPVAGEYSSGFGYRGRGFHPGVDIRAPYGAPIQAARAGRVVYAGRYYAYGLIVDIEHADGTVARVRGRHRRAGVLGRGEDRRRTGARGRGQLAAT